MNLHFSSETLFSLLQCGDASPRVVCQAFRHVAFGLNPCSDHVQDIMNAVGRSLKSLEIHSSAFAFMEAQMIAQNCTGLRKICIGTRAIFLSDPCWIILESRGRTLESLTVENLIATPNLRHLKLSSASMARHKRCKEDISGSDTPSWKSIGRNLEHLELSKYHYDSRMLALDKLAIECPNISRFSFSGGKDSPNIIEKLCKSYGPKLLDLHLDKDVQESSTPYCCLDIKAGRHLQGLPKLASSQLHLVSQWGFH